MWGAYASFSLGKINRGGGFTLGDVRNNNHNLYIGYKDSSSHGYLFPWLGDCNPVNGSTAYTAKKAEEGTHNLYRLFKEDEIIRKVSLGSESWEAGRMTLKIHSFFGPIADPSSLPISKLRDALCPTISVELTFNNFDNDEALVGLFGMQGVTRPLSDTTQGRILGVSSTTTYGLAVLADDTISEILDWDCIAAAFTENHPRVLKRLSEEGGLRFVVPPKSKKTFNLVLGVFQSGVVTSGIASMRYYSSLFKDLEDVLEYGLMIDAKRRALSANMDVFLDEAPLLAIQKRLLSHAAHSYIASTEFLLDTMGKPIFLVNEGEYRMMNTLDLVIDQAFWELIFTPWTVAMELEFLLSHSSYYDEYGLAFCHDQGVADSFSPKGTSTYELSNLIGTFSFMSYEETLNWALTGCLYINATKNWEWAYDHMEIYEQILSSLIARDANGDGIMDCDSSRCEDGAEITTYDSLDTSLSQARNNLYLAVKAWGTFISMQALFEKLGSHESAQKSLAYAQRIASTVGAYMLDEGYIPAVFESGNRSKIIPAIEGLVYPYFCADPATLALDGPNQEFLSLLRTHLLTILVPGGCLDEKSGGWKLSSTSNNTWLSKIFLNQFIADVILDIDSELIRKDEIHASWLFGRRGIYGMTDQVDSSTGEDLGSRLYPRLVTGILWMLEDRDFSRLV